MSASTAVGLSHAFLLLCCDYCLTSFFHFSQKQRRAAQRKERRKRKRQALAQARECGMKTAVLLLRLHEEWLERERLAQEEFRLQSEREEAARKRKEEEEQMIKEEWEAQQRKEQAEKEQKLQEKRNREVKRLENGGPWMNPEAPVTVNSENFGTERDVANCPFFLKTGACRFGDRCSRKHVHPTISTTLMVVGMFRTFGMEESRRDDYDMDACLEHSEEDLHESFLEFYHDVLPEFRSIGKVVQFKVSCNYEPHLRGNVYIQFDTEDECKEAFIRFNGRWYAGRQLHCELCPVTRWKNAICGLFDRQKCPKGKHCNFLHVFRNPGNEFWEADRDLQLSPNRSVRGSRRDGWQSERYGDRSWRQRRYSRSPVRSERSHSRREDDRRRSRSRERRDDKWSSRSRHSDRRTNVSKSRDKSRSRSRDRERDRRRNRSRDKDREHRNRSEDRDSRDRDEDTHRDARERSRSTSRERERRKRSRESSPKNPDKGKRKSKDESDTQRCHKRSKKSKKKSKKKHKKKSHAPEETTSSGESDKEKESEEKTAEKQSETSPSGDIDETERTQKNKDLDEGVDSQNNLSPEVKSEQSISEISKELSGNGDIIS
uniref:Zinc finger (CCCH type), RNA-binding motif and serine/arginine rich 2 n=1 Tax=Acanthochromis polyacanthus TaxID=80966 RepID=A0A3Q1G044_9TELE